MLFPTSDVLPPKAAFGRSLTRLSRTSLLKPRRFTLDWSRTWDDRPNDYVATDGAVRVGRVHVLDSNSSGNWFWSMYGMIGNRGGSESGIVETRDEACHSVEHEWHVFKDRMAKLGVKP